MMAIRPFRQTLVEDDHAKYHFECKAINQQFHLLVDFLVLGEAFFSGPPRSSTRFLRDVRF